MSVSDDILNIIPVAFSVAVLGKTMQLMSGSVKKTKGKGINWW